MTVSAKYWTLLELRDKVREDMDLQEETFISDNELNSVANEAIDQAEQEVHTLYEDYFLTDVKIPLVSGVEKYDLPGKIYAHKIRRLVFEDGSRVYKVTRIGDWKKFERKAIEGIHSSSTLYDWFLVNDSQGKPQINLVPKSHDTSFSVTISAANSAIDFIDDDAAWIVALPVGTYTDPVALAAAATFVMNTSGTTQTHLVSYDAQTMKFTFANLSGAVLSLPWATGPSFATNSRAAFGFGATDLAGLLQYTGIYEVLGARVTCWYMRQANRLEVDSDILDIPEAANFVLRFMKNRVWEKEQNPMLQQGVASLEQERMLMVTTLAAMVPDAENNIEPDFTMYEEMS